MKINFKHVCSIFLVICFEGYAQSNKTDKNASSDNLTKANEFYFKQEWKQAIPLFIKALGDTSRSALIWQRLAYCYFSTDNFEPALTYYKRSLNLNPNPFLGTLVQSQIMLIFDKQNKPEAAFEFLKNETANGFNNLTMVDTLRVFNSIRKSADFLSVREKVKVNAYPCLTEEHRNDFDFWVGEWDVYRTGTNSLVGHSLIIKSEGNCSVVENWHSLVSPQTGFSINYFNRDKSSWEQVYVGSGGLVTHYTDGIYQDNQMHFKYEAKYGLSGKGNFIFYNQGPDQVRQFSDFSTDGGKTYQPNTDLTYIRKKKQH